MAGDGLLDREALKNLVESHQAALYRYVRYLGADPAVAEDICQEAFLAAFRSASAGPTEPRAWLRAIARNLFVSHCRRERRGLVTIDIASLEQAEALWQAEFERRGDGSDYIEALRRCLASLDEGQRTLVDLQYARGMSRADIARASRLTEDGVKSAMRRLRARLAECVARRLGLCQDLRP